MANVLQIYDVRSVYRNEVSAITVSPRAYASLIRGNPTRTEPSPRQLRSIERDSFGIVKYRKFHLGQLRRAESDACVSVIRSVLQPMGDQQRFSVKRMRLWLVIGWGGMVYTCSMFSMRSGPLRGRTGGVTRHERVLHGHFIQCHSGSVPHGREEAHACSPPTRANELPIRRS